MSQLMSASHACSIHAVARRSAQRPSCHSRLVSPASTSHPSRVVTASAATSSSYDAERVTATYRSVAQYLRGFGLENVNEVARICDMAMNPNSLFFSDKERKRSGNSRARLLDVEKDIMPLVTYLKSLGMNDSGVARIIQGHPPTLCYDLAGQIKPVVEYLEEIGISDVPKVLTERPTLLALDVDSSLRKIVGWLKENDYTDEQIAEYVAKTL